jgi:hopanoid biosynthesis associated protein HpnK
VSTAAIINADDFGLSPGVNRGIVEAFRNGVLTSTTMLVNLGSFTEAAELARAHPGLGVGIHLSLLWGRPVSSPAEVPTLVGRDGAFPRDLATLARRYFTGRLAGDDVRRELRAQVRAFLAAGLTPTHLDTHKHAHCLPRVLDAILEIAGEFGIRKVRLPAERPLGVAGLDGDGRKFRPGLAATAKRRLVRLLCRGARAKLERAGLRTTDHFLGIDYARQLDAGTLLLILTNLRPGVTEIMCHPGYADEGANEFSSSPPDRETELAGLLDPAVRRAVESRGVRLLHFGQL